MKKLRCLNPTCSLHGNVESSHIIRYVFYRTTVRKRSRYRCDENPKTVRLPPSSPTAMKKTTPSSIAPK